MDNKGVENSETEHAVSSSADKSVSSSSSSSMSMSSSSDVMGPPKKRGAKKKKKKLGIGSAATSSAAQSGTNSHEQEEAKKWLESLSAADIFSRDVFDASRRSTLANTFHQHTPFKYLQFHSFLDDSFARALLSEVKQLDFFPKSNDLFEFAQSGDLKAVSSPLISKFKETLYGEEFRAFLTSVSGIDLDGLGATVDMSANVYGNTHTLLCHDDELFGRRIAYIYYLVPEDWSAADGGSLDLYDLDQHGEANDIVTSLVPAWNSFAFFEVSPISYHQVSEVLSSRLLANGENRVRISISGWFHGPPLPKTINKQTPPLICQPSLHVDTSAWSEQKLLAAFINPEYRKPKIIKQINKAFLNDSSIELVDFLRSDVYARLSALLLQTEQQTQQWQKVGPANKRTFFAFKQLQQFDAHQMEQAMAEVTASTASAATFLSALHTFFLSTAFSHFLAQLLSVDIVSGVGSIRCFRAGCYTLAHNEDPERYECGLDVTLCATQTKNGAKGKLAKQWNESMGGTIHYIEEGQEEELLNIPPRSNCLSIVYRGGVPAAERDEAMRSETGGVMKFVKYVNHAAIAPRFDADYTFRVVQDEEDEDDEDAEMEEGGEEDAAD